MERYKTKIKLKESEKEKYVFPHDLSNFLIKVQDYYVGKDVKCYFDDSHSSGLICKLEGKLRLLSGALLIASGSQRNTIDLKQIIEVVCSFDQNYIIDLKLKSRGTATIIIE